MEVEKIKNASNKKPLHKFNWEEVFIVHFSRIRKGLFYKLLPDQSLKSYIPLEAALSLVKCKPFGK